MNYKEYTKEVEALADEAVRITKEYEQCIHDTLHELIDGHQWVIYYSANDEVLRHTDNPDAWQERYTQEDLGRVVADSGLEGAKQVMAYWSLERDVMDAILKEYTWEELENLEAGIA